MVKNFDHVTIVVRDVDAAKRFFGLLGFKETKSAVISGKTMEDYMGVTGIEADHVTLALENVKPHTEVQLLRYRHPDAPQDTNIDHLNRLGLTTCISRSTISTPNLPSLKPRVWNGATRSCASTIASSSFFAGRKTSP
jgi:hypothetical protein